ncbi:hypothetical protein DFH11DRAFT_1550581 [Phellopilus nigrolimitatus]|nr:hypothetical protein DFH11DRAFT_1550581 [Phellopilus nigrolimitatus]
MLNSREAPPAVVALERNDETYNGPGPSTHHRRASRERQSHEISLQNANKHKWAALRFRSWATVSKKPAYIFRRAENLGTDCTVSDKLSKELDLKPVERLPPSLSGTGWRPTINYRLVLDIRRHGVLRPDSSISTLIGYTPSIRPDAPSTARRQSYKDKLPILGPALDPKGWQVMQDVKVYGMLQGQREVAVSYTLTYTRGSVIPCHLTLRSSDRQALDLLSTPQSPRVLLRRRLTTRGAIASREKPALSTLEDDDSETQPLAKAVWALPRPGTQPENRDDLTRSLMGELSVPLGCTPSFVFGGFHLEYFIDVYSPMPAGFHPARDRILASAPVSIASAHAEGSPRPRAYIAPAHDVSQGVAQTDVFAEQLARLPKPPRAQPRARRGGRDRDSIKIFKLPEPDDKVEKDRPYSTLVSTKMGGGGGQRKGCNLVYRSNIIFILHLGASMVLLTLGKLVLFAQAFFRRSPKVFESQMRTQSITGRGNRDTCWMYENQFNFRAPNAQTQSTRYWS